MDINTILEDAFKIKSSDIHLTTGVEPVFRVNGDLKRYGTDVVTPGFTDEVAKLTIPEKLYGEFLAKGQIDYSYEVVGVSRFRVNAYRQLGSVALAFRVVPSVIPAIEDLMLPDTIKKLAETRQGLILVTGSTGSGKTTTLAAMIDYINKTMRKHIVTLEDPIEYRHKHGMSIIEQREVGFDTMTFQDGLRASLRQDPDIILVGELRDLDTISTAITAAETGHLVLGTLHTRNATSTIDRIIDVFPQGAQEQIRVQLASVLTAVISQRLIKTADGRGRRAVTEIMVSNSAIASMIRTGKIHQIPNVIQTSRGLGMHLMDSQVKDLLSKGVISEEDALKFLEEDEVQ